MKIRNDKIEIRKVAGQDIPKEDKDMLVRNERSYTRGEAFLYKDVITIMWEAFLNGQWSREKPSRPGIFPVANQTGKVVGEAHVVEDKNGLRFTESKWATGYWFFWSAPRPITMPARISENAECTREPRVKGKKIPPWLRVVMDEDEVKKVVGS